MLFDKLAVDFQHLLLGFVGISHQIAPKNGGASRRFGHQLPQQAAGKRNAV